MRKGIAQLIKLGGISGIALAYVGISIDTWEFWVVWVWLLCMFWDLAHD